MGTVTGKQRACGAGARRRDGRARGLPVRVWSAHGKQHLHVQPLRLPAMQDLVQVSALVWLI